LTWKCYLWYPTKPISGFDIEKLAAKASILKFQFNFALFYFVPDRSKTSVARAAATPVTRQGASGY